MKFGRNLPRNQVPEWAVEYINYKSLKKLIKSASEQHKRGGEPDLTVIFFNLDRNLENVDEFYNKKYGDIARRLKIVRGRGGRELDGLETSHASDIKDLTGELLELRSQLRKLQWYGEVNRQGFIKITKKLDKKVPTSCAHQRYVTSRVNHRPFATNLQLTQELSLLNAWLTRVADIKPLDDADSAYSSSSLSRTASGRHIGLPTEVVDDAEHFVKSDEVDCLMSSLNGTLKCEDERSSASQQQFLLRLLQSAIFHHSKACIVFLLGWITSLDEDDDINSRNTIHRLVIALGRSHSSSSEVQAGKTSANLNTYGIAPTKPTIDWQSNYDDVPRKTETDHIRPGADDSIELLNFLLDHLSSKQRVALASRDSRHRLPIHYAAQYGDVVVCQSILNRMVQWGQLRVSDTINSTFWHDLDGSSPLHFSVVEGHPETTKALLHRFKLGFLPSSSSVEQLQPDPKLLATATKSDFRRTLQVLVEAGADINCQDEQGETALHLAARYGHVACARVLNDGSCWHKINLNIPEYSFGWTPLLVASVDGHLDIVELLINAGAKMNQADSSGWTAKEHAALRGHIAIATLLHGLEPKTNFPFYQDSNQSKSAGRLFHPPNSRLGDISKESGSTEDPKPVKSFGHRFLTDKSMVLVSLGSMDAKKNVTAVAIDRIALLEDQVTQADAALSVVVKASGASGEATIIDLPVQENISTEPIVFTTTDITRVKLLFDIVPTYSGSEDLAIGRGVALLSHVNPSVGQKRMNLKGDVSVPIIAAKTLNVIGTVNFNFLVITPFTHEKMSITESQTYWKSITSPVLIGHRGLGKNMPSRRSLQLGENTIQSFIAAANLGAAYVEFDVQVTKDHVPVIYHDFLVSETGIDAPVHALTLEQFLHVNDTPFSSPAATHEKVGSDSCISNKIRHRAMSMSAASGLSSSHVNERMRHTRDFKIKGFKGNSRGNSIQAPLATLEEMFIKLPESVGFNIEMKYPMLFESEDEEMDTYAVELNSFVDTVLNTVYDHCKKRDIIFSSFHPDICLLLSFKQPSMPVLFLSDAGTCPVGDIRASSLQEAIRFASRWNLLGVVSAAAPLVMCPRLVRVVKESGLVCVSYGTLNNEPANVKVQVEQGIDAVIVDSVLAVRKGLTHDDESTKRGANEGSEEAEEPVITINGVPLSSYQYGAVM